MVAVVSDADPRFVTFRMRHLHRFRNADWCAIAGFGGPLLCFSALSGLRTSLEAAFSLSMRDTCVQGGADRVSGARVTCTIASVRLAGASGLVDHGWPAQRRGRWFPHGRRLCVFVAQYGPPCSPSCGGLSGPPCWEGDARSGLGEGVRWRRRCFSAPSSSRERCKTVLRCEDQPVDSQYLPRVGQRACGATPACCRTAPCCPQPGGNFASCATDCHSGAFREAVTHQSVLCWPGSPACCARARQSKGASQVGRHCATHFSGTGQTCLGMLVAEISAAEGTGCLRDGWLMVPGACCARAGPERGLFFSVVPRCYGLEAPSS